MTRSCTFQTSVYVYASNIGYKREKKEKKGTRKSEAETERKTGQSLSHGWLPCESEKNNNKNRLLTQNEQRLLSIRLQISSHMFKRGMSKRYLLSYVLF